MINEEDDNISKLKFIGKLKKGDKINIKYMVVQQNNLITKLNRTLYNVDNRVNTLNFISDTIKKGFDELLIHISNNTVFDTNIANNIITDLDNCKIGLGNMKDTYTDDLMFCCKIDTILQEIDARLEEIKINKPVNNNDKQSDKQFDKQSDKNKK
jgi:hypothetical protein